MLSNMKKRKKNSKIKQINLKNVKFNQVINIRIIFQKLKKILQML